MSRILPGSAALRRAYIQVDTDMISIYHRSLKPGGSVLKSMESYNNELVHGDTNRAQELVNSLGGGSFEELEKVLTREIESFNLGDEYMANLPYLNMGLTSAGPGGTNVYVAKEQIAELEKYKQGKLEGLQSYLQFLEEEISQ